MLPGHGRERKEICSSFAFCRLSAKFDMALKIVAIFDSIPEYYQKSVLH
jgi:hypothetical protein